MTTVLEEKNKVILDEHTGQPDKPVIRGDAASRREKGEPSGAIAERTGEPGKATREAAAIEKR